MEMKEGQFGKVGEHMVGFELSKRGWIVFFPPYDERIDIVALKFVCEKCNSLWDTTHLLTCTNIVCKLYNKDIVKSKVVKGKRCLNCGKLLLRSETSSQSSRCPVCEEGDLEEIACCYYCNSVIDIKRNKCTMPGCDSKKYKIIFRTIQVKSTHLVDEGRNLGFNFKFQDLLDDDRHFFIIYNRDIVKDEEKHFYWILSVQDFMSIKNTETTAFKIYQNDRCHFHPKRLEKFLYNEVQVNKLWSRIEESKNSNDLETLKKLYDELKRVDRFRILDISSAKD
ncbi:hypothetical protein JZK55_17560 [Dissulfurispira thermophila]|uniref:Uncharacterized protein n=1 Tax=Dissulfurispira thermophila TaxID=2715679 RepID=A0A7G1H211_9BACT|nr:hypothetical protein [Dissulfurispira thermophila]BCB96834.1 hypothetical protein JZK55_17560 [Dissulfurispira thermophila]